MTTNRTPATSAASTATTSAASLLRHLLPALRALAHRVLIDAMTGMAHGLFASLILGTILGQLGRLLPGAAGTWLTLLGAIATSLTGAGIGVGVAHRLKAPTFVVVGAMVAGQVGARAAALLSGTALQSDGGAPALVLNGPGEPLGAFIAAWAAVEAGRLVAGRTSLDILVTPTLSVCAGGSAGLLVGPPISRLMISLGQLVNWGTERQPLLMGIIVSALMGIILTLPISSAALGIILDLSGIAAGAATVGCATQMVGFAVASFRENRWSGLLAQGVGTSMLQVPNIVRHPLIWVPPTLASAILGPIATVVLHIESNAVGSGMGTSGLVGQIMTWQVMEPVWGGGRTLAAIVGLHFIAPALLTLGISELMRRRGWIGPGDMALAKA